MTIKLTNSYVKVWMGFTNLEIMDKNEEYRKTRLLKNGVLFIEINKKKMVLINLKA